MRFSVLLLTGLVAVGVAASVGTLAAAQSGAQPQASSQSSLVEDYSYPGAAGIQASDGVVLVSGDGHILYADCATAPTNNVGVIKVYSSNGVGPNHDGLMCFKVTGSTGHIAMEIPAVYEIHGDGTAPNSGHQATADLTTDTGTHTTVTVNPSGSTPVGIGAGPTNAPTTLLAINVTG
jgi:hypothetical protein